MSARDNTITAPRAAMTAPVRLREVWRLGGMSPVMLVRRVLAELGPDDVWGCAAQLAYYFLFALFPFLIFLAALLAYIPVPDLMQHILVAISDFMPAAAFDMVQDNVVKVVSEPRGGLLSLGILLALWAASSAVVALAGGLNRAYGVSEGRSFWRLRGMALLLTLGLALLTIAAMILLMFGPELGHWLANHVGAGAAFDLLWSLLRWPVVVLLMVLTMALIYYFAPDVEQHWRWLTPGSLFAVVVWIGISLGFGFYVDNFGQYDRTYGSIGAVIVLLTWLYLSALTILVGGEINAEIENASALGKDKGEKQACARGGDQAR